jgi:hypothetical protein
LASVCLAHINRNYVFDGGPIDVRRLFKVRNLTRRVTRSQPKLTFQLRSQFAVLAMLTAPDIKPEVMAPLPSCASSSGNAIPARPDGHIGYLPRIHAAH